LIGLVPVQATILQYLNIGDVRPDLCLIASFLVGFAFGEVEGVLMGLSLGFIQDLFSAGAVWFNLMGKGLAGLLAGLMGRHLATATPTALSGVLLAVSLVSNLIYLLSGWTGEGLADAWLMLRTVLLPQALYDALLGATVYWLMTRGRGRDSDFAGGRLPFGR
jgi:uncharacterized membrane protein